MPGFADAAPRNDSANRDRVCADRQRRIYASRGAGVLTQFPDGELLSIAESVCQAYGIGTDPPALVLGAFDRVGEQIAPSGT